MAELERHDVAAVSPEELLGPLNDIERKFAPQRLWIAGHRSILEAGPRVAVIGSRKISPAGARNTESLVRFLVQRDAVIVSGLAEGVDTVAHETAIKSGGRTIAVLGTPIDNCYPAKNHALQEMIAREHLVVSQFDPGTTVQRGNFPIRNRLMALVAHASIIVEAGDTSGSLHQGWEALRLGRALFILEPVVKNPALSWPAKMLAYGAIPLPLSNLEEVLEALPPPGAQLHADVPL